jgi:hypothetical protein
MQRWKSLGVRAKCYQTVVWKYEILTSKRKPCNVKIQIARSITAKKKQTSFIDTETACFNCAEIAAE